VERSDGRSAAAAGMAARPAAAAQTPARARGTMTMRMTPHSYHRPAREALRFRLRHIDGGGLGEAEAGREARIQPGRESLPSKSKLNQAKVLGFAWFNLV